MVQPKATPSATYLPISFSKAQLPKFPKLPKISLAAEEQTFDTAAFGEPVNCFIKREPGCVFLGRSMVGWEWRLSGSTLPLEGVEESL